MNRKYMLAWGFLCIAIFPAFGLKDSIGIKTVDGIKYILHKVDKGQGLYAISKRYHVSISEIEATNPQIETLGLDQEILIPIVKSHKEEMTIFHTVEKGETLYRISKTYQVEVEDLKRWNKLKDNAIHEGDQIKIIQKVKKVEVLMVKTEDEISGSGTAEKPETAKEGEIIEEGIATYIEDASINSRKALALHKKAPIGSVIQVTNLMNGNSIYVKVVGHLDNDGSQSNEIIKVSRYTAKKLKIRDQLTRVRLNYFLE